MKIRNCFVSNSSSSSFIIISKNGELTKEKIIKSFKISEESVLYPIAKEVADEMLYSDEMTAESWKDEFYWHDSEEEWKDECPEKYEIYEKLKNNEYKVYYGSADSYESPALCEMEIFYEDDDIKIEKEGGY